MTSSRHPPPASTEYEEKADEPTDEGTFPTIHEFEATGGHVEGEEEEEEDEEEVLPTITAFAEGYGHTRKRKPIEKGVPNIQSMKPNVTNVSIRDHIASNIIPPTASFRPPKRAPRDPILDRKQAESPKRQKTYEKEFWMTESTPFTTGVELNEYDDIYHDDDMGRVVLDTMLAIEPTSCEYYKSLIQFSGSVSMPVEQLFTPIPYDNRNHDSESTVYPSLTIWALKIAKLQQGYLGRGKMVSGNPAYQEFEDEKEKLAEARRNLASERRLNAATRNINSRPTDPPYDKHTLVIEKEEKEKSSVKKIEALIEEIKKREVEVFNIGRNLDPSLFVTLSNFPAGGQKHREPEMMKLAIYHAQRVKLNWKDYCKKLKNTVTSSFDFMEMVYTQELGENEFRPKDGYMDRILKKDTELRSMIILGAGFHFNIAAAESMQRGIPYKGYITFLQRQLIATRDRIRKLIRSGADF